MPIFAGIIDFDYCSLKDKIKVPLFNIGADLAEIEVGERELKWFLQGAFPLIVEVGKVEAVSRGWLDQGDMQGVKEISLQNVTFRYYKRS